MGLIKIKKGLDLPIKGQPDVSKIIEKNVSRVAVLGNDYVGMKPTMNVQIGDIVKKGELLFTDKKMPAVKYTAPVSGKVVEINRGERRAFLSLVIEVEGDNEVLFKSYSKNEINNLSKEDIQTQLINSGTWTSFRARPFGKVANPDDAPYAIFVNAMDTNPLAADVKYLISNSSEELNLGLQIISKLTDGKIYFCQKPNSDFNIEKFDKLSIEEFDGPHPAGLTGTHIHFLAPVGRNRLVWYLNVEDVIVIAKLFLTGKIFTERIIALGGPLVKEPKLIKTQIGASVSELIAEETKEEKFRAISGSVFSGRKAEAAEDYLGRYHRQISVISDNPKKKFFGWLAPAFNKFSVKPTVFSKLSPGKIEYDTDQNGGIRAIVPIGSYEKVMPLDILPTFLLRSLSVNDVEEAEKLGCLELVEEDLALCTFVCPSKNEYGPILRNTLTLIEKEG